jgi:hypothetical protein
MVANDMHTRDKKPIFVYMEDTPVHRNVVARGLCRAAVPILRAVADKIDGIAIYPIGQWFQEGEFDQELVQLCIRLPRLSTILCKALRRYPAFDFGISDLLPPRQLAPIVKRSAAGVIFSFVGADPGTVMRTAQLASLAGKPYAMYVVDDFIAASRLAGAEESQVKQTIERVGVALRGAKHVFAITDGLGDQLRNCYGVATNTLPLGFEPEERPVFAAKNQVIYVGSINFLYAQGLRDLFQAVQRVRQMDGLDLTVRLTVSQEAAARELGKLPTFVISSPVETSEGLSREIASSLFAFLPYSFDSQEKAMVSTSFPSKSMEYLAYARSIVVYGPEYGVATKLFREMELPTVVSSISELEESLRAHILTLPDHAAIYRYYLGEAHSLPAIRNTLCENLELEGVGV